MPGQNFINGPPNPRGKEEYTLDGKIPIKHQKESWLKYIGLAWMVELSLIHTVYPFIGEGERRCLPFNAVYRIFDENENFLAGDLSAVVNPTFYTEKKPNE